MPDVRMPPGKTSVWEDCRHCRRRFNWSPIHYHWCSWDCYDNDEEMKHAAASQ